MKGGPIPHQYPDQYPIPNISMILGNLGKSKYFTMLDLKSGYHQIALAESDGEKIPLSVNEGKFEVRYGTVVITNRLPSQCRNPIQMRKSKVGKADFFQARCRCPLKTIA